MLKDGKMDRKGKTKIVLSAVLILVILSSSVYFLAGKDQEVRIDITPTRTQLRVLEDGFYELVGTEYLYLFDGSAKMRANSRSVWNYSTESTTWYYRQANYKDNITTLQVYKFDHAEESVENVPVEHKAWCYNCEGKIVHFEYRDFRYDGPTREVTSPVSFGPLKIEWQSGYDWAKVFQYRTVSDKLVIRYRPERAEEVYEVRMFDPPINITDWVPSLNNPQTCQPQKCRDCELVLEVCNPTLNDIELTGDNLRKYLGAYAKNMKSLQVEEWSGQVYRYNLTSPVFGNVSVNYTCMTDYFNYTLSPKRAWCWDYNPGNDSFTLLFEHDFESGDLQSRTVWWNEWRKIGETVEEKEKIWVESLNGIDGFGVDFDGKSVNPVGRTWRAGSCHNLTFYGRVSAGEVFDVVPVVANGQNLTECQLWQNNESVYYTQADNYSIVTNNDNWTYPNAHVGWTTVNATEFSATATASNPDYNQVGKFSITGTEITTDEYLNITYQNFATHDRWNHLVILNDDLEGFAYATGEWSEGGYRGHNLCNITTSWVGPSATDRVYYNSTYTPDSNYHNVEILFNGSHTQVSWDGDIVIPYTYIQRTVTNISKIEVFSQAYSTGFGKIKDLKIIKKTPTPSVSNVSITPDPAYVTSTLNCTGDFVAGGGTEASTFKWYNESVVIAGETSQTMSGTFVRGENISCEYTPVDDAGAGTPVNSSVLQISDSLPTFDDTPPIPDISLSHSVDLGVQLNVTDADSDSITYGVNDSIVTINASGYVSSSPDQADTGVYNVSLNATANSYTINSSFVYTITNTAPVFDEALTTQNITYVETLSYDVNCSDADGDTITYGVNDSLVSINQSGFISDTPTSADIGTYNITVSCYDGLANTTSSFIYDITNTAPSVENVSISPNPANSNMDLTCSWDFVDAEGESDQSFVDWYVDGSLVKSSSTKLCYQEHPSIANQTGLDGNCYLDYNGTVSFKYGTDNDADKINYTDYMWINYTKPTDATGAVWMVKHGGGNVSTDSYNITIPADCWSAHDTILRLQFMTQAHNDFNPKTSTPFCWNSTGWKMVGLNKSSSTHTGQGGYNQNYYSQLFDGNWNTAASIWQYNGTAGRGLQYGQYSIDYNNPAMIFEEAVIWNISAGESYLDEVYFNASDNVSCNVTPNDGIINGTMVSDSIIIQDTCTYRNTNTWNVLCSDNCEVTTNVDLLGNSLSITGTGNFTINGANVSNYTAATITGSSSSNKCSVTCKGGGCLR